MPGAGGRRARLHDPSDREIRRLALPALGALVAEPLFLLVDSVVVGRLGTVPLAGLSVAAGVLGTVVGLAVVLAYGTTAAVARGLGAGDVPLALRRGVDGIWLGAGVGVVAGLALLAAAPVLVAALGADGEVARLAVQYLRVSAAGLPAALVVLAATGVLRGLQDTRTPLVVAVVGAAANAVLSAWFVLGLGLGVPGSAAATVLVQTASAAAYGLVLRPGLRRHGVGLAPRAAGVGAAGRTSGLLLLRTAALRAVLLLATAAAVRLGTVEVAAHQVVLLVFGLLALALDAVAIAGQALVGRALGAGSAVRARAAARRTVEWGVAAGVVLGLALAAVHRLVGPLFGEDPALHAAVAPALLVLALASPLAGLVFALDGALIGAGDDRFLALTQVAVLAATAPALLAVVLLRGDVTALWVVLATAFLGTRALLLARRLRSDAWVVLGSR